jgi:protein-disulfide isomerase
MVYLLILGGLVLSGLSYLDWCSFEGCSKLHGAGIFDINLAVWGGLFFLSLGILTPFARAKWVSAFRTTLLAGALGIEMTLLTIQWALKDVCPLCLGVGCVVLALCVVEAVDLFMIIRSLKPVVPFIARGRFIASRSFLGIVGLSLGMVASQGVKSELVADVVVQNVATEALLNPMPSVGKEGGYPIVRVYSDYFCPTCRRQEPVINEIIAGLADTARIYFCDLPTQGNRSRKYIAFFIASLLGENSTDQILNARASLFELAGEQIDESNRLKRHLEEMGVRLHLDGPSIDGYFRTVQNLAAKDGVLTTPTVVVEGEDGGKKVFKGQFTKEAIFRSLRDRREAQG